MGALCSKWEQQKKKKKKKKKKKQPSFDVDTSDLSIMWGITD
jgi:hypothetical protein